MSRAEKFISDCTRNCSNELIAVESRAGKEVVSYHEWLTPDQAKRAVEIAREEVVEKVCEFLDNDLCCYIKAQDFAIEHQRLENDLKQAIKDE
jgi:chaperone required for assembly of F1-ATPase